MGPLTDVRLPDDDHAAERPHSGSGHQPEQQPPLSRDERCRDNEPDELRLEADDAEEQAGGHRMSPDPHDGGGSGEKEQRIPPGDGDGSGTGKRRHGGDDHGERRGGREVLAYIGIKESGRQHECHQADAQEQRKSGDRRQGREWLQQPGAKGRVLIRVRLLYFVASCARYLKLRGQLIGGTVDARVAARQHDRGDGIRRNVIGVPGVEERSHRLSCEVDEQDRAAGDDEQPSWSGQQSMASPHERRCCRAPSQREDGATPLRQLCGARR